jgi:hypothetical protein
VERIRKAERPFGLFRWPRSLRFPPARLIAILPRKAIWQDLVSENRYTGSYQAVKRFVQKLRGPRRPEAAGSTVTAPGEKAQVHDRSAPTVRDPQSGKYRRARS